MIKLHGTVEIGKDICIHGFTFEYPGKTKPLIPLILIDQREALRWAKDKITSARIKNWKAIQAAKKA